MALANSLIAFQPVQWVGTIYSGPIVFISPIVGPMIGSIIGPVR